MIVAFVDAVLRGLVEAVVCREILRRGGHAEDTSLMVVSLRVVDDGRCSLGVSKTMPIDRIVVEGRFR